MAALTRSLIYSLLPIADFVSIVIMIIAPGISQNNSKDCSSASGARDLADVISEPIIDTDEVLKVIPPNPKMVKAYKAAIPGDGQPFPEGSMIVKLQWKPKKNTEAQFAVDVPDVFKKAFVTEKDSKPFPKTGGWGYAVFNYDAASDKFTADPKSLSDCGNTCHTAVKSKDYIFHPYQKR
jgi:hypothetical protein